MQTIETRVKIGADGILDLKLAVGAADADREVIVTIRPAHPDAAAPGMTHDQWVQFLQRTEGSIQDPTFVRRDQGQFEDRQRLP